jgi:hypothetical protein
LFFALYSVCREALRSVMGNPSLVDVYVNVKWVDPPPLCEKIPAAQ